jgi:hypothetical protein
MKTIAGAFLRASRRASDPGSAEAGEHLDEGDALWE